MSSALHSPLETVAAVMRRHGAVHVVFKMLSNNDNSKQQIYFGGDFDVLRMIPHGEMSAGVSAKSGPVFKAPLNLSWLTPDFAAAPCRAPGAQLIFYPKYPEVRMSGFLQGCPAAPSSLMQPPTSEQRELMISTQRCLVLGICSTGHIIAYVSAWNSNVSSDANNKIATGAATKIASVFYEEAPTKLDPRRELIQRLRLIHGEGAIPSEKMNSNGFATPYKAANGAGYTLESKFGIIPNGRSDPDFMGWELKAHSGAAVTLMTPEPDTGTYLDDLSSFLVDYGRCGSARRDFTGRHQTGVTSPTTMLTLTMEGYDHARAEIIHPDGGLFLRDSMGNSAAGWTFKKLVNHWSKKHSQTAYISYSKVESAGKNFYQFGPDLKLCEGASLKNFLQALSSGIIYYDPGVKQTLEAGQWRAKKRNQFRVAWKNVAALYDKSEKIEL